MSLVSRLFGSKKETLRRSAVVETEQCIVMVDYVEFKPETYKGVLVESPTFSKVFNKAGFLNYKLDLQEAMHWLEEQGITDVTTLSSVDNFETDLIYPVDDVDWVYDA